VNGAARLAGALVLLAVAGCEREARRLHTPPEQARLAAAFDAPPPGAPEGNAYELAEGKRLFVWFNCVGCHANGGGGMGPSLMDAAWRYGSEPAAIYASIVDGRPNGMPAYGHRIPQRQVLQLTAYVRSLAGFAATDAAPGRNDAMQVKPAEQAMPAVAPSRERVPAP
jgi:cytochrome c oxidase cbb3-type subunit 3